MKPYAQVYCSLTNKKGQETWFSFHGEHEN